jgi:hypothetical protein
VGAEERDPFAGWFEALQRRHLASLSLGEVRRALTALSSLYVERRERLAEGAALEGEGKRAAFALFYGPVHFLATRGIIRALGLHAPPPRRIFDLGCGTGVAGSAWALECGGRPPLLGIDRSGWAVGEAIWTYRELHLKGSARRGLIDDARGARPADAILAAYAINELDDAQRARLLEGFLAQARRGVKILVVEPIARRAFPWWPEWSEAFVSAGGRSDEWRFPAALPETLRFLSTASGMDHDAITAKSLWLATATPASRRRSSRPCRR